MAAGCVVLLHVLGGRRLFSVISVFLPLRKSLTVDDAERHCVFILQCLEHILRRAEQRDRVVGLAVGHPLNTAEQPVAVL